MTPSPAARDHAVVLGGSMAGLLAARVLADRYRRVTVVERDQLGRDLVSRRGVPQGRHLHALHPRGADILEELFPGLQAEMAEHGAITGDVLAECRIMLSGHRFARAPMGQPGLFATRPFIEGHVRARLREMPSVALQDDTDIAGLTTTADRTRVTGVRIAPHTGHPATVEADLVVDATGRGSRTPRWLEELAYERPTEDRVEIGLSYTTRTFRLRPDAVGTDKLILIGSTPANPRAGVLVGLEDGRHMVTLAGILGDHPPTEREAFTTFAASLLFPDIADALAGATPCEVDGLEYRFPASIRRRYERLDHFPRGLLVLGDAVCSFNPVYGQGMTTAALQALVLRARLTGSEEPDAIRYFRGAARVIDSPWDIAVGADLAYPGVPGRRTTQVRLVNAYLPRLHAAATTDTELGAAFMRVLGLLDRPEGLMRPDRLVRVWRGTRRRATAMSVPAPSGAGTVEASREPV
jgi:2-polyprenyl-6-methoxyphenol hydroxylase-like FAD-dependent oxidoreductase